MRLGHYLSIALLSLLAIVIGCNSMQTSSAILRFNQGEYDMADSLCIEALKVNPDDGEAYFYLALSQSKMGEYKKAYGNFRKAAELKPERAEMADVNIASNFATAFNEGVEASRLENFNMAIEAFMLATEANPENSKGYTNLGKAYWGQADEFRRVDSGEYTDNLIEALSNLETALSLEVEDDSRVEISMLMGKVLGELYVVSEEGVRDTYLTQYRNFSADLPGLYQPHEAFGNVLADAAQMQTSKVFFGFAGMSLGKAAEIREEVGEPEFQTAALAGNCFMRSDHFADAAHNFDRAILINPSDEDTWFLLEFCQYKNMAYAAAIKAGKAIQTNFGSTNPDVYRILFLSYRDLAVMLDEEGNTDGFLENRTFYEEAYYSYATYKGLGETNAPPLLSKEERAREERRKNVLYEQDGVAVIEASIDGRFVVGVLLNKNPEMVEYVEISIDLLDFDGDLLGSAYAEFEELPSDEETEFSAAFIESDVEDFEITEILVE